MGVNVRTQLVAIPARRDTQLRQSHHDAASTTVHRHSGEFLGQVKSLRWRVGNFQASFTVLLQPLKELLTEHVSFMEVFHFERTETDALPRLLGDAFQREGGLYL